MSPTVSLPKRSPPAMIQFLYSDSPLARPCARALPHVGRQCRRPYRGRLLAVLQACSIVSWPCHCAPLRAIPGPVSRYNALYRYLGWEMGSSPPSYLLHVFFFSLFFVFNCSTYLEDHKNTFFFLHFPVDPNKFIKIYFFIFYFPVLHTIKPQNFFFLQHIFFPMCYSPSTRTTQHTQ